MPAQNEKDYYTPQAVCIGGIIQVVDVANDHLTNFLNRKVFEDREPMLVSEYLRISKDFWRGDGLRDSLDIIYEWKDELHVVLEYVRGCSPTEMRKNSTILVDALAQVGRRGDRPHRTFLREHVALGGFPLVPELGILQAVRYKNGLSRGRKPVWADEAGNIGFFTGRTNTLVQKKQIKAYYFGGDDYQSTGLSENEIALIVGACKEPVRITYPSPQIVEFVAEWLETAMGSPG